jgi:ATP-binding cassette subfamily B (MDR/TAP) protein 1
VQVGKFVQLVSTFIGGFVIAFIKGWLLTLVMLSSIPLLVASGAVMSLLISKMASAGQSAYANAANIVEQTIGSIRTVRHVVITKHMPEIFWCICFNIVCQFIPIMIS